MKPSTNSSNLLDPSVLKIVDTIGGIIEFWGFKRSMGRMWTVLYLESEPLAAQDLVERLSMSTGSVSMTLQELLKWGVVKKTWRPGARRDFYEAETSIWGMISRVFRERELVHVQSTIAGLEAALAELKQTSREAGSAKPKIRFITERVESLLALARVGEGLLLAVLAGQRINSLPIKSFVFGPRAKDKSRGGASSQG